MLGGEPSARAARVKGAPSLPIAPLDSACAIPIFPESRAHSNFMPHLSRGGGNCTNPFTLSSFRACEIFFSQMKYLTQIYVVSGFKNQFDWPQETYFGISGRQAARRSTTEAPSVHHPQGKCPASSFCSPLLSSKIILCNKIK